MQSMEPPFQSIPESHNYAGYRPPSTNNTDFPIPEYSQFQPPSPQNLPLANEPFSPYGSSPHTAWFSTEQKGLQRRGFPAFLCYIGLWLTGLLFLLFVKNDRFIRFHAMQSLLFFGAVNVLYIVFLSLITRHVPYIFGFAIFAFVIMNVIATVAWIVGLIGALQGRYVKLPFVGDFAERYANTTSTLK